MVWSDWGEGRRISLGLLRDRRGSGDLQRMKIDVEKVTKFAALGAIGVAPGALGLYAALLFLFRPTPTGGAPGSGGGFDAIGFMVVAAAMLVPLGLAAAWHVDFGKQLQKGKNSCPGV